jgi:hypothetical protein
MADNFLIMVAKLQPILSTSKGFDLKKMKALSLEASFDDVVR